MQLGLGSESMSWVGFQTWGPGLEFWSYHARFATPPEPALPLETLIAEPLFLDSKTPRRGRLTLKRRVGGRGGEVAYVDGM